VNHAVPELKKMQHCSAKMYFLGKKKGKKIAGGRGKPLQRKEGYFNLPTEQIRDTNFRAIIKVEGGQETSSGKRKKETHRPEKGE